MSTGRTAAPPRPRRTAPARPRRGSATTTPTLPLLPRAAAFVAALPDHRWLDRIVRGRAWIPMIGVLLVGIVAMQVEVLKLGANIGRSMTLATELQSRNQLLRASVAQLSDDQRIERAAARMGMVMPGPTEVRFDAAGGRGAVSRALSGITAPNPTSFLTSLQAERTAAAGGAVAAALAAQAAASTAASAASTSTAASATSGGAGTVATVTPTVAPSTTGGAGTTGSAPATNAGSTGAAAAAPVTVPSTASTPTAGTPPGAGTTSPASGGVSVPAG